MTLRLVHSAIRLQALEVGNRWRAAPLPSALALVGLVGLVLVTLRLVVPPVSQFLEAQYLVAEEAHGRGPFLVALLHLAVTALTIAAVQGQIHGMLLNSGSLRVVYQRARHPVSIGVVLQAECVALLVLVDLAFAPFVWWPFLGHLSGQQLWPLILFRLLMVGLATAGVTLVVALRYRHQRRGGDVRVEWLAALGLYALGVGFALLARQFIAEPTPGHLAARVLRGLRLMASGSEPSFLVAIFLLVWLLVLPLSTIALARTVRRYGA